MAIKLYGFVSLWLWVFLGIVIIMTLCQQNWMQTLLAIAIGGATFIVLFGAVRKIGRDAIVNVKELNRYIVEEQEREKIQKNVCAILDSGRLLGRLMAKAGEVNGKEKRSTFSRGFD